MDLSQVLPNLPLAAQAADVGEAFLELAPDGWRERGASARRFVDGQERLEASFLIALKASLEGMAMHGQQFGQRQPGARLPARQQVEGLPTQALSRSRLTLQLFL